MSSPIFTKLNIFEKAFVLWAGVCVLFNLIFWLIGYWPPWSWVYYVGLIGLYLAEEIWRKQIRELKRRMQELEDRIDDLETRIPKPHPLANPQG
jgi:membrane protein implicated in regulation of membrane protease activity